MRETDINIIGSCVSRDLFEYDREKIFQIKRYVARNSVFSVIADHASSQFEDYFNSDSKWADRMLEFDYKKNTLEYISEDSEGWLLVDFIDERLGLFELENTLFTNSVAANDNLKDNNAVLHKVNPWHFTDERIRHSVQMFCKKLLYIYPPMPLYFIVLL